MENLKGYRVNLKINYKIERMGVDCRVGIARAGIPPTGNETIVPQMSIFRIVDGKIAEEWSVVNPLVASQQMEVIPPISARGGMKSAI